MSSSLSLVSAVLKSTLTLKHCVILMKNTCQRGDSQQICFQMIDGAGR